MNLEDDTSDLSNSRSISRKRARKKKKKGLNTIQEYTLEHTNSAFIHINENEIEKNIEVNELNEESMINLVNKFIPLKGD